MRKKILCGLAGLAIVAFSAFLSSCGSCKSENENQEDSKPAVAKLNVGHVTATDREYMFVKYKGDYRWFEQCVLLKNFLDEENDNTVLEVKNIFQVVEGEESCYDVHVIFINHTNTGESTTEVVHSFWLEDYPLNDEAIKVSFEEAYDKMMQTNYPKPHSRHCVLRNAVGAKSTNPQYIFGNSHAQIYVDAVTGEVSDKSPFDGDFGKPLGEWP